MQAQPTQRPYSIEESNHHSLSGWDDYLGTATIPPLAIPGSTPCGSSMATPPSWYNASSLRSPWTASDPSPSTVSSGAHGSYADESVGTKRSTSGSTSKQKKARRKHSLSSSFDLPSALDVNPYANGSAAPDASVNEINSDWLQPKSSQSNGRHLRRGSSGRSLDNALRSAGLFPNDPFATDEGLYQIWNGVDASSDQPPSNMYSMSPSEDGWKVEYPSLSELDEIYTPLEASQRKSEVKTEPTSRPPVEKRPSTPVSTPALPSKKPSRVRSKQCIHPGCPNRARSHQKCKKHGGAHQCTFEGCTKNSQSRGLCIAHGGGSRCRVDGCSRASQSKGLCKSHGGGEFCRVDGCKKKAHLKHLCRTHGGGVRCKHSSCNKWAQRKGWCMAHAKEQLA